jgi:hypothetical protein
MWTINPNGIKMANIYMPVIELGEGQQTQENYKPLRAIFEDKYVHHCITALD